MESRVHLDASAWLAPGSAATWDPVTGTLTAGVGTTTIFNDPGDDAPIVNVSGAGAVLVIEPATTDVVHLGALNLTGGATATLAALPDRTADDHRVLVIDGTGGISVDTTSKLDLTNGGLVVDYDAPPAPNPTSAVEGLVARGYGDGRWLGTGITSSTAASDPNVALATADNVGLVVAYGDGTASPTFAGVPVDDTAVLVKFTWRIDMDLDGVLSSNDRDVLLDHYEDGQSATWATGDLDYDGVFDTDDVITFNAYYDESLESLPAPRGLSASASGTQVTLTWYEVGNAATYTIYRVGGAGPLGGTPYRTGITGTSFNDLNLPSGNTYAYAVSAVNASGEGLLSAGVSARIGPAAPTYVVASVDRPGAMLVEWQPSETAGVTYNVYRGTAANFTIDAGSLIGSTAEAEYVDEDLPPVTAYYYAVVAVDAAALTSAVIRANDGAAATTAPAWLTATGGVGEVVLSWQPTPGAVTYNLYKAYGADPLPATPFVTGVAGTTYTDAAAGDGASVTYAVEPALSGGGVGAMSLSGTAETESLPEAPTYLAGGVLSDSEITIVWEDNAHNEEGYRVERLIEGGAWTAVTTVAADESRYDDSGLEDGKFHTYRVIAVNAVGDSAASNPWQGYTPQGLPDAPSNFIASPGAERVDLSWDDTYGGGASFTLLRSYDGGDFVGITSLPGGTTSFADTNLMPGSTYAYELRAVRGPGPSAPATASATPTAAAGAPGAPSGLSIVPQHSASDFVDVSWTNPNAGSVGIHFEVRDPNTPAYAGGPEWLELYPPYHYGGTSFFQPHGFNTTLEYRARYGSSQGWSLPTDVITVTTGGPSPAAPSGLTATLISASEVRLTWQDNAADEGGFFVRGGDGYDDRWRSASAAADETTAVVTGLKPGREYTFEVRSWASYTSAIPYTTAPGYSAPSNQVTVTTPATPEPEPTFSITPLDPRSSEKGRNPSRFLVTRVGNEDEAASVHYELDTSVVGAAEPGEDHDLAPSGTALFERGDIGVILEAEPSNDQEMEATERVIVALDNGQQAEAPVQDNNVLVILIAGHTQNAGDDEQNTAPASGSGIAELAGKIQQLNQEKGLGFIVKPFSEDPGNDHNPGFDPEGTINLTDCGDSMDAIMAELRATADGARQLRSQGLTPQFKVAFIGFSHGGGLVQDICVELADPDSDYHVAGEDDGRLDVDADFSVAFTSYIDAIEQPGDPNLIPPGGVLEPIVDYAAQAETRRPHLAQFHLNQYQSERPGHSFDFLGAATADTPAELNIDYDAGGINNLVHWDGPAERRIDRHPTVHTTIIKHLEKQFGGM